MAQLTHIPLRRLATRLALMLVGGVSAFCLNTAIAQPDPNKVLRVSFPVAETGFDPVRVHDLYSSEVVDAIFERVVHYDYLARPPKLVAGGIAEAMPEVTDGGKTYTIKLKKGIAFGPAPEFKGKKRELVAADVKYNLMRHMDHRNKPVWKFLLDGKIVGLDEWAEAGKKANAYDYDAKIEGLEVVDAQTIRIKLKDVDYNFNYILAHTAMGLVAREVIESAGLDSNSRPVGTGPFMLGKWARSSLIELVANPNYHGSTWDFKSDAPEDQALIKDMTGKKLPRVGKVEIRIIVEDQPGLLAFKAKELDYYRLQTGVADQALKEDNTLKQEFLDMGVKQMRVTDPEMTYHYFNMTDPVWGGYTKEKIALRRAALMAWDTEEQIRVIRKRQAVKANYIVPPGIAGHQPDHKPSWGYDIDVANKLLDRYGYKRGADGVRNLPDGKPFVLEYVEEPTDRGRQFAEMWDKGLKKLGIRFEYKPMPFAEALKKEKECKLVARGAAWIADYPDGDNFMMLLYGPNTHESNNACFKQPDYDKLYEQSRKLPNGPERDKLYKQMHQIVEAYSPWALHDTRLYSYLNHAHVQGYKKHPILQSNYLYVDMLK